MIVPDFLKFTFLCFISTLTLLNVTAKEGISEKALVHLEAPVYRVTGFDTPFPYSHENHYLPTTGRIIQAAQNSLSF